MEALKAEGVSRDFGGRTVLQNFSYTLPAGGFEALMGPSGSGKSTFLHLAAGLLSADSGEIFVGGRDVAKMRDGESARLRRRHVGVVFQAFNLLNEKTVAENIALPLKLDGRKVDRARLDSLARLLGISVLLDRRAERLSGGEQQRVAIARALITSPDVILADEPTGNLDSVSSREICELLRQVNRAEKSAILVVTHDPQVAAAAERVNFLKDGRIAASCATQGDAALVSRKYLAICG